MEGRSEPNQYLKKRNLKIFPSLLCFSALPEDAIAVYKVEQKFNRDNIRPMGRG